MANTEGLPDEFVESLATPGSSFASSASSRQKEQKLRERLRKNRLQQRMELPMGGAPAAKIVRASPNNQSRINKPVLPDDDATSPKVRRTGIPLVGNVIEHKQNHNQSRGNRKTGKVSRFASQNRQSNASAMNAPKHASGFPSVHNVPLGTFVKRKKKASQQSSRPTLPVTPKEKVDLNSTSIVGSNSLDQMKEASKQESDAMLADMSLEEIKDRQQEIEQALSPDLIAFLRQRRKKKSTVSNEKQKIASSSNDGASSKAHSPNVVKASTTSVTVNSTNKNNMDQLGDEKVERDEKERIANLVASIRTHEDLDATYRVEMKGDAIDFDVDKNSSVDDKKKEEFLIACDLLRSSSPRQALWAARTVSLKLGSLVNAAEQEIENREEEKLETSLESTNQTIGNDGLPTVLPVSLRCLLDKPLVSSCNYLLHTYALQSLYYLTIIYAHPDHDRIDDNSSLRASSGISIFQEDFMDDAVPSPSLDTAYPPMTVRPLSVDENSGSKGNDSTPAAAYMTSSSTSSAQSDGEEFKKDPMWTLLSKMKIIPRLAFLLEHQQHLEAVPTKAFASICGIISMVGQRSPGAASAIMKHKSLTSLILKRMLQQIQRGRCENAEQIKNDDSDEIVFSALRLFCILSRQSRIVAEDLPLEDILPPLLATGIASSRQQFLVQQHALFLWRTTLRYGLGLEALASMLTVSARHFALPYFSEFSLSSDFLSSFTLVLECVKVVRSKDRDITSTTIENEGSGETPINEVTATIVGQATKMMASSLQTVLPKTLVHPKPDAIENLALRFRWNASRLHYLSNWFHLFDRTVNANKNESIEEFIPLDYQETLLLTLRSWAAPGGDVDKAWNIIPKWGDSSLDFKESSLEDESTVKIEASASAYINAYFLIALVLLRSRSSNPHIEEIKQSFHRMVVEKVITGLKSAPETPIVDTSSAHGSKQSDSVGSARARWINQCQFSVAKFCFHSISVGLITTSSDISAMRGLVFALLGRLRKGDESIAAVLFSSDILFQTSGNPVQQNDDALASASPISSMFLGEICGSQDARKQLDHSFKLQHGFGITSAGFGLFQLDSLLSNAELPNSAPSAAKDNPEDKSFPLGRLWLWQTLSGSIRMGDKAVASGTKEAAEVIAAVLELILDLDETEEITNVGYAGQLSIGSKLYYLMNVCLHHEQVLRDERVLNSGEILLDRYLRNFGCNDSDVVDFCQECLDHSGHSAEKATKTDDEDEDALNGMDKKLLDKFSNALTIDLEDSKISSEQMRAMVAFVEDLTTAYRDYGAQYDFFTKCIRVFLLPLFPSLIRCRGFRELENMLHLLTIAAEFEDEVEMTNLVSKSLTGGLPAMDNSIRDDNDVLNAVAKAIASSSRPLEGYMRHYCIGTLVRNFAISLSMEQGVEISKKRLKRLGAKTVQSVCRATELFLQSYEGTKSGLVEAIICSSSCEYNDDLNDTSEEQYVVQCLDSCIARYSSRQDVISS